MSPVSSSTSATTGHNAKGGTSLRRVGLLRIIDGAVSSERAASDVALRSRRPARPSREGDRLARTRGDRRPRGRCRAGSEERGARERRRRCSGAREKPVFVRVNAGTTTTSRRLRAAARRCHRPEGRAPGGHPGGRTAGARDDRDGARGRGGVRDRLHPAVRGISLGEADLRSQTGALEDGLDWARGRIVNAAVAAGLPRPPQSVYTHVRDLEGLARSCHRGRELGHLGRSGDPSRPARR